MVGQDLDGGPKRIVSDRRLNFVSKLPIQDTIQTMAKELKQVVLMRRDLRLRRAAAAALTTRSAFKFFIDNNVSEKDDVLTLNLSHQELGWIEDGCPVIVLGVSSETALRSLVFRAEASGVSCHPTFGHPAGLESDDKDDEEEEMLCASLGPDESSKIDEITGNLKLL